MAQSPYDRVHRQVHRLFNLGVVGTMSDGQLLDQFVSLSQRDEAAEAAFEELVIRHGPMVYRVCRSALHDAHDAEDAFQAVFVVLANRARSVRRSGSVASWLFGVAQRVAHRGKRTSARRRALEERAAARTAESYGPAANDRDFEIIHAEIDGLPERLRSPIVLCYLEGMTYAAAAYQLGLSQAAIRGRLARGRERLRQRLIRRGVTLPAGLLAAGAAAQAQSAIPVTVIQQVLHIALGFAAGNAASVLARGVLNSMLLNQLKTATVLLCLGLGGSYWAWHAVAGQAVENRQTDAPRPVPIVQLIHPPVRKIVRTIAQPSFIEASERTAIKLKRNVRVDKSMVGIGDRVKKGDILATLFAPELVLEDYEAKGAAIGLAEARVDLGHAVLNVAGADVHAAEAHLSEARSNLAKQQAMIERWDTEVKRLDREVKRGVVDPQVLVESTNQREASIASRNAAKATIKAAEAELSQQLALANAQYDVKAAETVLAEARIKKERLDASVARLPLIAPYDGVIVGRNVTPVANDEFSTDSPALFVIDKIDVVRVSIDIPEPGSQCIGVGTKATILAKAYSDRPITGSVTRISRRVIANGALNTKGRTLRAEIDLPNPGGKLKPGFYAYARLVIERPAVWALPLAAVTSSGDRKYCWTYENGRSVRTAIETGVSDGQWIEVTGRRVVDRDAAPGGAVAWTPMDGSERVILGDLSLLRDGGCVEVAPEASR